MAGVDLFDFPAFKPECRGGMRECADKLMSEAAEVFGAVRNYGFTADVGNSGASLSWARVDVAGEIADVMQVCRNICEVCEITPELMSNAVGKCVDKNRRRDGGRYE